MFDKDLQIKGKHATYWKALTQLPGNAIETTKNFKIFENYIHVFMVAPIIGIINNRQGHYDPSDDSKDTAGMLAEIQIKYASKLKYIYRLIILSDTTMNLTDEEKIRMAFTEDHNEESVKKGMDLYMAYFLGGLEFLYEEFVEKCITDDDYIRKMYDFVSEFNEEQSINNLTIDIEKLLTE